MRECGVCAPRADSAGASSMIESDSISVSDVARADKTSAGGGLWPDEAAVVLLWRSWPVMVLAGPGSHLRVLKRRLNLELNGVGLLLVERRRQGDDEW